MDIDENNKHISIFPSFSKLRPHHQKSLEDWAKISMPYSDYNFISLWTWDHQNKIEICTLNDNLVIKFQGYQDNEDFFYSFLGTNMVDETAKALLNSLANHPTSILRLIPEFVIEHLEHPEAFKITEDRDNHDYILGIKNMIELEGPENRKKRNALRQFIRDHEHHLSVDELDLNKERDIEKMRSLVNKWINQSKEKSSFNQNEIAAIDKMLSQHPTISTSNLQIVGIHLGDELKAFSIAESLNNEFAIWHYKKTDRSVNGLGVALDHYTAKQLHERGHKHLNYEQDLGLEGLRQSKMASQPVFFLKKYTISY